MKKYLAFLILAAATSIAIAQPAPRLIVRGDDMGYTHSGNLALIKCYQDGIQHSVEVIVASPWFPEAVKLLEENPGVDVGVHLAITSEWDNEKWRPLTNCPSIRDADGYFFPMVFPNPNYPGRSIKENNWSIADIEKEFRAQIEGALKKIPRISHLSSHMGCTDLTPEVKAMTVRLAKEYHLEIDFNAVGLQYVGYNGPAKTPAEKIASFKKMLEGLQPGKTYVFVDHPGLDGPELQAIHHIGYENVAADRQGVVDCWTDASVKEMIRNKGIQLISFKDLVK